MTSDVVALEPIVTPELPQDIETPALIVDRARLEANIARLQAALDARGVALRPHAKTHKSVRIARLQIEAGARGLTVGTLGEAEVFAAGAIRDLFLAYPIWAVGAKAGRVRALHDETDFVVGVDSVGGVERLAAAVRGARRPLRIAVEVDPGLHRTGVEDPAAAVDIARAARRSGLAIEGVFAHGGHGYRIGGREAAARDEVGTLEAAANALEAAGFDVPLVSAGSTPTMLGAASGRVNEIRAGTYVLGDRQQWALAAIPADGVAAFVAATVVSVAHDHVVLDAGAKTLTKDRADWLEGFALLPGYPAAVVEKLSDYHGVVTFPRGGPRPALGEVVAAVPNHVCPVVDLFDSFLVLGSGGHPERWPVDARGRSG
ncbi:MAG TPA: alanine racemase [Candidatus Limnocylindrales bacterium]|nr:alanine racemase [Candidatus Limnocylindrales bacterium]